MKPYRFYLLSIICFSIAACNKSTSNDVINRLPTDSNKGVLVQKASIPVIENGNISDWGRTRAVSFVIGNYGFVGLGGTFSGTANDGTLKNLNDFWKYDPSTDTWAQIAGIDSKNMGNIGAAAFSIGDTGYVGLGFNDSSYKVSSNFFAYDYTGNKWSEIAPFPGAPRAYATAFAINGKGFAGTGGGTINDNGDATGGALNDFYQYDPQANSWTSIQYPGTPRLGAMSFVYQNTAYILGGRNIPVNSSALTSELFPKDFYSFDGAQWKKLNSIDDSITRQMGVALVINDFAYLIGGTAGNPDIIPKTWAYKIAGDQWQEAAPFTASDKVDGMFGFVLNNNGYIGGGELYAHPDSTTASFYKFYPDSTIVQN